MRQILLLSLLFFCFELAPCVTVRAQDSSPVADAARQQADAKPAQATKSKKVVTNEDLQAQKGVSTAPVEAPTDPVAIAFFRQIAGRWDFSSYHKGNTSWWRDHGLSKPKTEVHYLFGPKELLIETRPELDFPSVSGRFGYGSVRKVSEVLFDVELYTPPDRNSTELKRFKLSGDGKTLEISVDRPGSSEPTVQDLKFVSKDWSANAGTQNGSDRKP